MSMFTFHKPDPSEEYGSMGEKRVEYRGEHLGFVLKRTNGWLAIRSGSGPEALEGFMFPTREQAAYSLYMEYREKQSRSSRFRVFTAEELGIIREALRVYGGWFTAEPEGYTEIMREARAANPIKTIV